jgi:asparagine synthase (glutamine-hydrolysing)
LFAYLASQNSVRARAGGDALAAFAANLCEPPPVLECITLEDFRLDFFDTENELSVYQDGRHVVLLVGSILNKDEIESDGGNPGTDDAEMMLRCYREAPETLNKIDGHWSFLVYDWPEKRLSLIGDRFHRYSTLYLLSDAIYVSSHSRLLLHFSPSLMLDKDALSQSLHFRWLTGGKRLFEGIQQVLPGCVTSIDNESKVKSHVYHRLKFRRAASGELSHWADQTAGALDDVLARIAAKHPEIGIPLSAGVDSSLLLAMAKEHFDRCVAVTVRFPNGENPELENARYFARKMGIRHIVVDMDDAYIRDFFPKLLRIHEQPPRNYSDIALARALEALSAEVGAFLYGEAADGLFGSPAIGARVGILRKSSTIRLISPVLQKLIGGLIPAKSKRLQRLKALLANGSDEYIRSMSRIEYATRPEQLFECYAKSEPDHGLTEFLAKGDLPTEDRVTNQIFYTSVVNHVENTGRMASYFDMEMFVPFILKDLLAVAARLPLELQCVNGVYKPVLRELACRYFDRNRIYSQKHGFPTPTVSWLKGPLRERIEMSRRGSGAAKQYYSVSALAKLSIEEDYEAIWYAICLDELLAEVATR